MNDLNVFVIDVEVFRTNSRGMKTALCFDAADRRFVYAVGRRFVRDDAAAEDVAQEAMMIAFRHRDAFRGESHPRTWLYRIATTTALGYLRKQQRRDRWHNRSELGEAMDPAAQPSPFETLAAQQLTAEVQGHVSALDPKYADVIRLRANDLRDHEIAAQLGITTTTVKVRAHRARGMLRQALAA